MANDQINLKQASHDNRKRRLLKPAQVCPHCKTQLTKSAFKRPGQRTAHAGGKQGLPFSAPLSLTITQEFLHAFGVKMPAMRWVKSEFQKFSLSGEPVKFRLARLGVDGVGKFDVLGPNKDGLLQITIVQDVKSAEDEMRTRRYKLIQSEADCIRRLQPPEGFAFCCDSRGSQDL